MTKRHYFTSVGIFIAATFFIKHTFDLLWPEAIMTVVLAIVCVLHTFDVMRDIDQRRTKRRGEYKGPERRIPPPDDPLT